MALQDVGVRLVLDPGSFYADLGKANDAVGQIGNKAKDGGAGFNALEQIAIGSLRRIGEAAINAGAQLAQGIAAGVVQSVQVAGEFEGAVNNLAAVSGTALQDAGFNFDDVSQKALQLGVDTAYSASESIAAMTELVKGGVPVAQVMAEATDHTLALAAAAGIQLGPAAEIVAKQFGVWGETGVTTANVVDLITQASNASTVGAEDLALGLAQAGGTAKTAGVEFDDLVQTMALISPNFSSASDAGTSLKTFLSRLIPTTKPAIAAMSDLGLYTAGVGSAFYDASGSFIGMEAATALLHEKTKDLSEEERLLAFNTIFGSDAIRAAAAIANAGAEGFNAMGDSMAAAGTASETAAIQNQGFDFAMDQLAGTLETIQIIIGTALLPILTQFLEGTILPGLAIVAQFAGALTGNQEALAGLSPPLQQAVAVLQTLGAALMSAGPFSAEFGAALASVAPALAPFISGIQTAASFLQANWQPAVTVAGGVLAALLVPALAAGAAAFGAAVVAAAPVIAIFALIGVAAAALYGAWQQNFGGIQEATTAAMTAVQSVVSSVLAVVLEFWNRNGAEIMATAQQAWTQVQQIIGTVVAIVAEIVSRVFGGIASFLDEHGATIQRVLEFAWNNVQNTIDLVMNTVQGIVTTILGVITGDWETASSGIQQIVDGIFTYLDETFGNILSLITDLGPDFLAAAQDIASNIIDGIVGGIEAGIGAVVGAVTGIISKALGSAETEAEIQSPSRLFAREIGMPISLGIAVGILDGLPEVADAIETLADETKEKAIKAFEGIGSAAAKMFDDALTGREGMLRTRQKALKDIGKFEDELQTLREKRGKAGEGATGAAREKELSKMAALERERALAKTADERRAIDRDYQAAQQRLATIDADIAQQNGKTEADFQRLQGRLSEAQSMRLAVQGEADNIAKTDAVAAQEYMALRESQIAKILELQAEQDKAVTNQQKVRANQTLFLERQAQELELEQFRVAMEKRAKETAAIGSDFEETGVSLIDGMIAGIRMRSGELSAALSDVMGGALRTAQQQLGIHSPSLVFAQQVGMPISEGIAMGVTAAMPVALGAVADMASGLVRPAAPAMGRGGSSVSNVTQNFNYSPSYNGAPRQPSQDFSAMRALATAG